MGRRDIIRDCHPRMVSQLPLPDVYQSSIQVGWNDVIDCEEMEGGSLGTLRIKD